MIINKTGHDVAVISKYGITNFPSTGKITLKYEKRIVNEIESVKIYEMTLTSSCDIPEKQNGIYFIVSSAVKYAFPNRDDFIVPLGKLYGFDGNVIGCQGFSNKFIQTNEVEI